MSTDGVIEPTGLPFNTRLSRFSMEQRAPFLVLKSWYARRHTATTSFSEIVLLVRCWFAVTFASLRMLAMAALSSFDTSSAVFMLCTTMIPIEASGKISQNDGSAMNFCMANPFCMHFVPSGSKRLSAGCCFLEKQSTRANRGFKGLTSRLIRVLGFPPGGGMFFDLWRTVSKMERLCKVPSPLVGTICASN